METQSTIPQPPFSALTLLNKKPEVCWIVLRNGDLELSSLFVSIINF